MKNKAPLALMEQMVMIAVFSLAAALCLQAFVKSNLSSRQSEARDQAALLCQSTAEVLLASGGDFTSAADLLHGSYAQGLLWVDYDENWEEVPDAGTYRLTAQGVPAGVDGLGKARIWVSDEEDGVLFELEAAWQEVIPHD